MSAVPGAAAAAGRAGRPARRRLPGGGGRRRPRAGGGRAAPRRVLSDSRLLQAGPGAAPAQGRRAPGLDEAAHRVALRILGRRLAALRRLQGRCRAARTAWRGEDAGVGLWPPQAAAASAVGASRATSSRRIIIPTPWSTRCKMVAGYYRRRLRAVLPVPMAILVAL